MGTSEAAIDPPSQQDSTSCSSAPGESSRRLGFSSLRGVQWRTNLGILPSSSSSIEEFRRVAADSRRSYAVLRRRLLVDPHLFKDGNKSSDLSMDNPLSQNPDSQWVRFFQNAELEKIVDQDLSRLYPEQGSYFQTPACQAMLRRILLLWCVKHPECGYKQGMHELLAPLLYVLHVDLQCLLELQKRHKEHFVDDTCMFFERNISLNHRFIKKEDYVHREDGEHFFMGNIKTDSGLGNLDLDTWSIVLSSESYGAEGELGAIVSERFMEHDGYCMFDSLMGGARGVIAMADFLSPNIGSNLTLSPVMEGSAALYYLLSAVDSSLHDHLVRLGVEPQYFALRWLRILFVREFSLENLLLIWDEILSASNTNWSLDIENTPIPSFWIFASPRGTFISAMAVSMLLYLRSSLLAIENATSCLQKLLNFPENIHVRELIEKAKSLQDLVPGRSSLSSSPYDHPLNGEHSTVKGCISSPSSLSSKAHLHTTAENYWEEKWRVLNQEDEHQKETRHDLISGITKKIYRGRLSLSGLESNTSPSRDEVGGSDLQSLVRRRSLDDLTQETNSLRCLGGTVHNDLNPNAKSSNWLKIKSEGYLDPVVENNGGFNWESTGRITCSSEDKSMSVAETRLPCKTPDRDGGLEHCQTSNSFITDNSEDVTSTRTSCCDSPLTNLHGDLVVTADAPAKLPPIPNSTGKQASSLKERRILPGKFPWLWKFGRSTSGQNLGKGGSLSPQKLPSFGNTENDHLGLSVQERGSPDGNSEREDNKITINLKNLGQSIVENVEVIEKFIKNMDGAGSSKNVSRDSTGSTRRLTAMEALKELRRISKLLSDTM